MYEYLPVPIDTQHFLSPRHAAGVPAPSSEGAEGVVHIVCYATIYPIGTYTLCRYY